MDNLDSPLKPIIEITEDINTNATLLKRGFKIIQGTTIAKFHRDKRLERAKDNILDNDIHLLLLLTNAQHRLGRNSKSSSRQRNAIFRHRSHRLHRQTSGQKASDEKRQHDLFSDPQGECRQS